MNILPWAPLCIGEKFKLWYWSPVFSSTHGLLKAKTSLQNRQEESKCEGESFIFSPLHTMIYKEGSEEDTDWWETGGKKKTKESILSFTNLGRGSK